MQGGDIGMKRLDVALDAPRRYADRYRCGAAARFQSGPAFYGKNLPHPRRFHRFAGCGGRATVLD